MSYQPKLASLPVCDICQAQLTSYRSPSTLAATLRPGYLRFACGNEFKAPEGQVSWEETSSCPKASEIIRNRPGMV